ncbi:MAG: hypothetical protein EPN82_07090 [Bacteroidetes bacterium]|nr:MAG: hypothetical protein EPN82_07090 [Bacteroidota bacterium]
MDDKNQNRIIDVLLKEYEDRRNENSWHTERYHKQIKFVTIYFSILISIISLLSNLNNKEILNKAIIIENLSINYDIIIYIILIVAPVLGFYLFTVVLDALFMLAINGIRAGIIEIKINKLVDNSILVWNHKIISNLFSLDKTHYKSWIKPNLLLSIWVFIIYLAVNISFCIFCYYSANSMFFIYSYILIALTIFHLYQFLAFHLIGVQHISDEIHLESEEAVSNFNIHKFNADIPVLVIILSIMIGYIPMLLFSIQSKSFLPSIYYQFPFSTNISVLVGDLFFIPLFNFYFLKLIINVRNKIKVLIIPLIVIFLFSLLAQFFIHWIWISDSYLGFMDLYLNKLSFAGWWHLFYSVIETTAILLFLFIAWKFRKLEDIIKISFRGFIIFTIYSFLSIIDLIIQENFVYKSYNFTLFLYRYSVVFIKLVLVVIILIGLKMRYNKLKKI